MEVPYENENNPINDAPVSVNTCLELEGELSLDCELEGELIGTETTPVLPVLIDKSITDNGIYHASDDNADGYANVTVEVETDPPVLIEKSITDNGIYLASDDEADGYSSVSVEVPAVVPTLIEKSVNVNGTYIASEDAADGYSKVTVEVPDPVLKTKTITENGIYTASSDNADGYSEVDVSVPPPVLKTKSIIENGTYLASEDNADGYSKVTVNIQPVIEPFIYNIVDAGVGFNSGHIHTANTKVRMKASFPTWGGYGQAFGARADNYNNSAFGFFPWFDGLRPCFYRTGQELAGSWFIASEDTTQMWYGVPVIVECYDNKAEWYIEDYPSVVHSLIASSATVNAGIAPIGIFCCNNTATPNGWNAHDPARYMTLYWMEIYESDVLVHRFVPSYNNNQYCLYDEIDKTYIYECNGNYDRLRGSSNIPTD